MKNLIDRLDISYFQLKADQTAFEARMDLGPFHAQPQGYLNGGASLAFCEISAGMASNELLPEGSFAVGQSISAHHLRPKKAQGYLLAQGQLLHAGKHSQTWEIHLYDDSQKLISQATVTNAIISK